MTHETTRIWKQAVKLTRWTPPTRASALNFLLLAGCAVSVHYVVKYRSQRNELRDRLEESTSTSALACRVLATGGAQRLSAPPTRHNYGTSSAEDSAYLESIFATVFPDGHGKLSDEAKCVRILKFVACHLTLGLTDATTVTEILRGRRAYCGGFALAFAALVREVGLPTRTVTLWGLPKMASHTAVEVHYQGRWHFFDPTFGVLFYSQSRYDGHGNVLSLEELLAAPDGGELLQVVYMPWTQDVPAALSCPVTPVRHDYLQDRYEEALPSLYRKYLRLADPVTVGAGELASHPLLVDLSSKDTFQLGKIDQQWRDVHAAAALARKRAGSHRLGALGDYAVCTLVIQSQQPCLVQIELAQVGGVPGNAELVPLASLRVLRKAVHGQTTTFQVRLLDATGIGILYCPHGTYHVDSVRLQVLERFPPLPRFAN